MMTINYKAAAILLLAVMAISGCQNAGQTPTAQAVEAAPAQAVETAPAGSGVWFDTLAGQQGMTPDDQETISAWLFAAIFEDEPPADMAYPDGIGGGRAAIIFASISDGVSKADVVFAAGETTQAVLDDLASQIDGYIQSGKTPLWAKIDFVDSAQLVENYDFEAESDLPRSLYGLAFERESGIAILPDVLVVETIIDSKQTFRLSNLIDYQAEKGARVDFLEQLSGADSAPVFRFSTSSYFYEDGAVIPLYRGHRSFMEFTQEDLLSALIGAQDYLIDAVADDGQFVYSYFAKSDSESDTYNILRHAGTIYAMMDLYEQTGSTALRDAATRAIGYLMRQVNQCPVDGGFENCVVEDGEAKLGGNGLAVLALTQYMQATGSLDLLDEAQSLASWIVSNQSADGEFVIHKLDYPSNEALDFNSQYYPGEAIYALAKLYRLDNNPAWLNAAAKGAKWLSEDRIAGKESEDIIHDHWLLLGLDELQHLQPDPVYTASATQIAEAIRSAQNLEPIYPDWYGSYYDPPRSTPTATRSEGLMAAYRIARDFGSAEEAAGLLETVRRNITFQLSTQFYPESVLYLPDPARALGGFHRDLTNFEIRNDYVQHNVSAILAFYRAAGS